MATKYGSRTPAMKPARSLCFARSSSPIFPSRNSAVIVSHSKTCSWPSPAEPCNDDRRNPGRRLEEGWLYPADKVGLSAGALVVEDRVRPRLPRRSPQSDPGERGSPGDEEPAVYCHVFAALGVWLVVDGAVCG